MQSTVRRRRQQSSSPPARYVPCFSRARERHYPVTRCSLSCFPALVRLVHAACRTSALNQNHVALAYPSAILPAHDCGIARTIRGCAATIQVSNSSSSGDGMRVDGSLSVYLCLLHAKHSPILREWCQNPPTRRHLTGQAPDFLFWSSPGWRRVLFGMVDLHAINF